MEMNHKSRTVSPKPCGRIPLVQMPPSGDDSELQERPESISSCARDCDSHFLQVFNMVPWVREALGVEYDRFLMWANNIGMFAELRSSLDFRLRELDDIRREFLAQLSLIASSLLELLEKLTTPTTNEDAECSPTGATGLFTSNSGPSMCGEWNTTLESHGFELANEHVHKARVSIRRSIDWLQKLANLITSASFASQNRSAELFTLEDIGIDGQSLLEYYKVVVAREFEGLLPTLLERLAKSMVIRRRQYEYRQRQQKRLRIASVPAPHANLVNQTGPLVRSDPGVSPSNHKSQGMATLEHRTEERPTAFSAVTMPSIDVGHFHKLHGKSRISSAVTTPFGNSSTALIPPPPNVTPDDDSFTCPYCWLVLPSEIARNLRSWR